MSELCKKKFFNESFFTFVLGVMDNITYNDNKDGSCLVNSILWDVKDTLFKHFVEKEITYQSRVMFFALLQFFNYHKAEVVLKEDSLKKELNDWMRIIRNLAYNTSYNNSDDYKKALEALKKLALAIYQELNCNVFTFFANDGNVDLFSRNQVEEEREKAKLRIDAAWDKELVIVEDNNYFKGQIYFLLHISNKEINSFIQFRDKAIAVFHENMQKTPCLFHRALLALAMEHTEGDYSEDLESADRWSFFKNDSEIKNRFLRQGNDDFYYTLIKLFLDQIQSVNNTNSDIEKIINTVSFDETKWQTFFITIPDCFDYCEQKRITWCSEGEVYLLKKSQMNHRHAELRTYYLWKTWIENNREIFEPFKSVGYWNPANSQGQPCAFLDELSYNGERYALEIHYKDYKYQLEFLIREPKGNLIELLDKMNEKANLGFLKEEEDYYSSKCNTMGEAKNLILNTCESLKKLVHSHTLQSQQ
jgi:hypothetical protein